MTLLELVAYFEYYATRHLDILHTPDEPAFLASHTDKSIDDIIKLFKKPTFIVLLTPDKKMFPPLGDNYNWDKNVCFFILQHCGRKTIPEIVAAQSFTEVIGNDLCTRLIDDRYTKIRSFKQDSFVMQPVGPISDDCYGQVCMFNLVDEFEWMVNPNRWAPGT
jgi:hypothetical protein